MKPAVKYGLINGALGILWALIMYITELNRSPSGQWINILGLVFPIIFMSMAIKEYKEGPGNGWINFGKAFKEAFIVGLIGGIIGITFYFIYLSYIDPTFVDFQKQMQMDKMIAKGMSDEAAEQAMAKAAFFMKPGMQVVFGMIASLFITTILSLIIAAIMKKPNPEEIS